MKSLCGANCDECGGVSRQLGAEQDVYKSNNCSVYGEE